jgi:lipoate-protein ligase B
MIIIRLAVLCLLAFFNVEVIALNLTSQVTGFENIPPCGVSRLSNEITALNPA